MAFPDPSLTVPALDDWQIQYNGLLMGVGTSYDITEIDGLDLPNVRNGDVSRPRDHGQIKGLDLLDGRDITITMRAITDSTSLQDALTEYAKATNPLVATEKPLYIKLPNMDTLAVMCRVRKRTVPIDQAYSTGGMAQMSVAFHATDPLIYANSDDQTVGLPGLLGGVTFDLTFDASFGGGGSFGGLTITNNGNAESRPLLIITGPCTDPVVTNVTTGWSLSFSNPDGSGYTIGQGEKLTVDLDARSILFQVDEEGSTQSRRNWLVTGSVWPDPVLGIEGLAPGDNSIEFSSTDSSVTAASLEVEYADAYLI